MPIRKRGPRWHYRFNIAGREYAGSTGLLATEDNRKAAQRYERTQRELIKQGRGAETQRGFAAAAGEFIGWCRDVEYRKKASTAERIRVSFASLVSFLGNMPVVSIDAGEIERYKTHRVQINAVKDVTLRHDLHALSLFFQYAQRCTGETVTRCVRSASRAMRTPCACIHCQPKRKWPISRARSR